MAGHGRRALVVDDTAGMRVIVGRILRGADYEVVEASNGAEAIQTFFREQPDVVLMDLTMEGMDGAAAVRGILQINADARIIICSATSDQQTVVGLLRLGVKGYLTKPFTPEKLLKAIDAALPA